MYLRKLLPVLAALLLFVAPAFADEIRIAAASDLQFAMQALGKQFTQQTGYKLLVSYGSSGNLYSQIWTPLRVFFPSRFEGRLRECSVEESATGKRIIAITLDAQTIKVKYNPVLMDALQSVEIGTALRVTQGPHHFISRIEIVGVPIGV